MLTCAPPAATANRNATASISGKKGVFKINASECTECDGEYDKPQCVKICPIKGCITQIAA